MNPREIDFFYSNPWLLSSIDLDSKILVEQNLVTHRQRYSQFQRKELLLVKQFHLLRTPYRVEISKLS